MFNGMATGLCWTRGGKMKNLIEEYRLEFVGAIIALVGIFLVSQHGRVEILLKQGFLQLVNDLNMLNQVLMTDLPRYLRALPVSTVIGWLLVLLAVPFVVYRVRYRFTTSEQWQAEDCPRCGSGLRRTHRNSLDRFLSYTLMPSARRYRCKNTDCHWNGLRRRRQHQDDEQILQQEITDFYITPFVTDAAGINTAQKQVTGSDARVKASSR
jgi:hypothetical protein